MDIEDIATISPSGSPTEPYCGVFGNWVDRLLLVLAPISILCCLITIFAITIPLFDKEERNKMSAYNLYLVFLAIPDLIMSIGLIVLTTTCDIDTALGDLVVNSVLANILVNTVILYEILKFLVDSKNRRRCTPPSLFKASMQALAVYAVTLTVFFFDYFALIHMALLCCAYGYLFWVLIRICCGRLLCYNSDTLDRLKVLLVYFARIICLNMVTGTSIFSRYSFHMISAILFLVWLLIQIWIGFGLSLIKPDVLEYVRRLFACVVRPCSKIGSSLGKTRDPTLTESQPTETDNPSRDPETGNHNGPGDFDEGDKHEDGSVHIEEETEDCDRQENTEVTTASENQYET